MKIPPKKVPKKTRKSLKYHSDKWKTSTLFNELNKNKGLAGYNVPNPAKELYRIRRGSLQPWPENSMFRSTIERSFEILEKLVNTCTSIVTESFGLNFDQLMEVAGEPNPMPHDRKYITITAH